MYYGNVNNDEHDGDGTSNNGKNNITIYALEAAHSAAAPVPRRKWRAPQRVRQRNSQYNFDKAQMQQPIVCYNSINSNRNTSTTSNTSSSNDNHPLQKES